MEKPVKATFELEKTSHKTPALIFFGLAIPLVLFGSMMRITHLEQSFVYNEEVRLSSAKETLFNTGCAIPREKFAQLTTKLEEVNGSSSIRMKETFDNGFKEHALYKAGEQLSKGEKYVSQTCEQAIVEVSKLKRGSPYNFVISNFFGSNK